MIFRGHPREGATSDPVDELWNGGGNNHRANGDSAEFFREYG
jgi:hypothetical protein